MQLLLQPKCSLNRQKSTKVTERTSKHTPNAAQIAAYITAFIAIKLGEGRV
jgi:ribosomal protein S17E